MVEACVICHEFKSGNPVEDTLMLRTLRKLKADFPPIQILWGKPTGNTLVVCAGCEEKFLKRRKGFEGKVLLHAVLSAGLVVFIVVLPLISGTFTIGSIIVGLLLTAMLMALPLLDYVPPLTKEGMERLRQNAAAQKGGAGAGLAAAPTGAPGSASALPAPNPSPLAIPTPAPFFPFAPSEKKAGAPSRAPERKTPAKAHKSAPVARRRR